MIHEFRVGEFMAKRVDEVGISQEGAVLEVMKANPDDAVLVAAPPTTPNPLRFFQNFQVP